MQAKIAILVCYLGPLPGYFPLWAKSCAANPSFDFLLLTDQQPGDLPPNVRCMETSLPALRRQFSEMLGMEISLERPYKLCDFKPLYGELFAELLRPYDFWGHCDLDQIFGCLPDFIDDALLKRYDKFYKLGHLTIYRNDPACNARYRLPGYRADWREIVTKPAAYLFDEDGMNAIYAQGGEITTMTGRCFTGRTANCCVRLCGMERFARTRLRISTSSAGALADPRSRCAPRSGST